MLSPVYYFSFESCRHIDLFKQIFVWDILKILPDYIKSQKLGKIEIAIPDNVYLENPELISIGEGTVIEPGVYIKGPVIIGKNCKIRQGAYIRENVILEDGSFVGHDSEIKSSVFLPAASAAHFNYVGDSLLGLNTNLGAGVKCANVRLDKKEVCVRLKDGKRETGLKKFGLILGDRSQIGCNGVTNPGTLLGKDVLCPGGIVLNGLIPSGSKIEQIPTYRIEEGK